MNGQKILLVEDDENLGFVTSDNLIKEGYQVDWARNGTQGLSFFSKNQYNLCLLDVMLPNLDGFSLARAIRSENEQIPIIFLTARSLENDRLNGFEIGGDDYVTKPYSMKELLHRIQVFIRRQKTELSEKNAQIETIGAYSLDTFNLILSDENASFSLTQREADLLFFLVRNKGQLVKRADILEKIWGENDYFKGRSLDVFISRLRKYLINDPKIKIKNHHGVGFTLTVE